MKEESVRAIFQTLQEAEVRFLLVGGLAVNAHGFLRATRDVDLVILLEPTNVVRAFKAFSRIDYHPVVPVAASDFADPKLRERWRAEKHMIVLKMWSDVHRETPIDIFIEEPFDFPLEYSRARLELYEGHLTVPVVALGTLLQMKESAARPQDLVDVHELKNLHNLK